MMHLRARGIGMGRECVDALHRLRQYDIVVFEAFAGNANAPINPNTGCDSTISLYLVPSPAVATPRSTQASSSTYPDAPSGPWIELNHRSIRRIWVGRKRFPVREDTPWACSAADILRRERPSPESWRAVATTRCSWGWGRSVRRSVASR